jgi:signal transduction histidine kinase
MPITTVLTIIMGILAIGLAALAASLIVDERRRRRDLRALRKFAQAWAAGTGTDAVVLRRWADTDLREIYDLFAGLTKQREKARHDTELRARLLDATLEHFDQPVAIVDAEDRVIRCNSRLAAWMRDIGHKFSIPQAGDGHPADSDGKTSAGLPGGENHEGECLGGFFRDTGVNELIRTTRDTGLGCTRHIKVTVDGRLRSVEVLASNVTAGEAGTPVILTFRDQTEWIASTQMKADFSANASHELRTPLASIRAAVETVLDAGTDDQATVKRCMDIISGHVSRMQLLVQDLLDLSRTEDPNALVRTDVIKLAELQNVLTQVFGAIAAQKNIELRFDIASDAGVMRGDERLILLTLKNLVDNSIKFTSQGSVIVRSYRQMRASAGLRAQPLRTGAVGGVNDREEFLILEVKDTGCGIPPEDRQRVFERFYTVNRSRGGADRGTGLGLAIVKHAVAAMGGVVELESQVNVGTTMRCVWPMSRVAAGKAEAPRLPVS